MKNKTMTITTDVNKMSESEFATYLEEKYSIPVLSAYRNDTSFYPESEVGFVVKWGSESDVEDGDYQLNCCAILRFTSLESGIRYKAILLSSNESDHKHKISALHEVGHSFEIESKDVITKEIDAWNFAESEAKKIGLKYNRHDIKAMLGAYILKYNKLSKSKKKKLFVKRDAV